MEPVGHYGCPATLPVPEQRQQIKAIAEARGRGRDELGPGIANTPDDVVEVPVEDGFVHDEADEAGLGIVESELGRPPALCRARPEGEDVVGTGHPQDRLVFPRRDGRIHPLDQELHRRGGVRSTRFVPTADLVAEDGIELAPDTF
jgi:hypothetical protein